MEPATRRGVEMVWGASRLLVVGDVQGNADALRRLLERSELIADSGGAPIWTGGAAVLLLLGDLIDGGSQPAEALSLVMGLTPQARAQSGRVLVVQGNHERMLLSAFSASGEERESLLQLWFSQGGLETLARLAAARGAAIPAEVVAATFVATLGDLSQLAEELARLVSFVECECADELAFLARQTSPAALINGCVLGVHAGPNFDARDLATFAADETAQQQLVWDRRWLSLWPVEVATLASRLAVLKARLDDRAQGVDLHHIAFAHTQQEEFRVSGYAKGTQYRIGRLVARDAARGVPGVYNVMTTPRALPRGGALGGLSFGLEGVVAVYGSAPEDVTGLRPQDELLGEPDPAFPGGDHGVRRS